MTLSSCLKLSGSKVAVIQLTNPCWFHVCVYDVIFLPVLVLWRHKERHYHKNKHIFSLISHTLQSPILCIFKVYGLRGGTTEILTMISVQKCQFLAISANWTNVYTCCTCKLMINIDFLGNIHNLDFPLIIQATKIRQFHISQFWSATGPISQFVVLALLWPNDEFFLYASIIQQCSSFLHIFNHQRY